MEQSRLVSREEGLKAEKRELVGRLNDFLAAGWETRN
jgi:hypothetical protein